MADINGTNAEDELILACSVLILAATAGLSTVLMCTQNKRKHASWVKKYIRERQYYGVCHTLLPELAANEVLKCVQYLTYAMPCQLLFFF